jgi:hypothetical protein
MWPKEYRDYPIDSPLIQEKVEPSHGIIGCEMHELNGWGHGYDIPKKKRRGLFGSLLVSFIGMFTRKKRED